jgi:hypothetical protein
VHAIGTIGIVWVPTCGHDTLYSFEENNVNGAQIQDAQELYHDLANFD